MPLRMPTSFSLLSLIALWSAISREYVGETVVANVHRSNARPRRSWPNSRLWIVITVAAVGGRSARRAKMTGAVDQSCACTTSGLSMLCFNQCSAHCEKNSKRTWSSPRP